MLQLLKLRKFAADQAFDKSVRGPLGQAGGPLDAWAARRAPLRDVDRALMSPTHLWLRKIPPALHPKALCRHHPRLANQFAEKWPDYRATDQLLAELTTDRRGHRVGFSPRVIKELRVIQVIHHWRKYNPGPLPVRQIAQICHAAPRRPALGVPGP